MASIWHPTFHDVAHVSPSVHFRQFHAYVAVNLDMLDAMLSDNYLVRCQSRSQGSWVKTPTRGRGTKVPQWCGCGFRPVLRWCGTELNPDSPFYGCENYNTSGQRRCGLFVWEDVEEDEVIAGRTQCDTRVDQVKMNLGSRVSKLEAEIRVLKCWGLGFNIVMMVVLFGIVGKGGMNPGVGVVLVISDNLLVVPALATCIGSM
ncbi:hypothetical protein PIB30_054529 [Stylosanthes scabra]|uniref:Zinc finger GRF-type domain-containing protein n=1 Tax=Stylosanthes scabra TaxID=79078 RepID=A0ABU6YJA2_9FABA|nr:hypothetical protein [Stylosanthes scabra]